jgi:hypothetical protein
MMEKQVFRLVVVTNKAGCAAGCTTIFNDLGYADEHPEPPASPLPRATKRQKSCCAQPETGHAEVLARKGWWLAYSAGSGEGD